ncbi:hypothetical protein HELRODRAFT_175561 [Helobdella robusta]|uniref:Uncharacterized protein n=1 Tax=Helobdella robusta TaxID=6412 RepID=T1F9D6_HELRO|nr:hypothetical protein HELRODRAFT_175561 [Helobdella robusta]ESO00592.1 hypothetical protein HELRODRAFT_175561 [Helobdella robusta]
MSSLPLPSNFTLYSFPSASSSSSAADDGENHHRQNHHQSSSQTTQSFSLVDICSEFIVKDRLLMKTTIEVVPKNLFDPLLKASLKSNQDKSSEEIISSWPWEKLVLYDIVPSVFPSFKPLFSKLDLMENVRRGVKYTTSLVHTYMENLKKQKLMKLRWLDLSGFPSVEVIVNYIVAHVLLVYNERNQKEEISFYNQDAEHLAEDPREPFSTEGIIP